MAKQIQYWPKYPTLLNGGTNYADKEWKIPDNQTAKALNMWWKDGELGKRFGQDWLNADEVVESPCYSAYKYLFQNYFVKHCGTKLYKQSKTGESTVIYSGLAAEKGSFFKFNQRLYYIQPNKYLEIKTDFTISEIVPYIPTVIINRTPTGGGNTNEQYNRIGKGFKNSFNGDGTAKAFTLTDIGLDATAVTATVNGAAKVETTDFTVNRTTGVITFTIAPSAGQNNVIITAYKTVQSDIDTILNCKKAIPFGGQNDNRMFFGSNGTGYYYWTGISTAGIDATYFPYNNYNIIGNTDDDISEFGKHYNTLTIHKVSGEIYGVTYEWDGAMGIFSTFSINAQYGCDCPDTMQYVDNNLVWLNSKYGVCILVGTSVGSQRNAFPISRNINPELMKLANLKQATSVENGGKYWLCVGDKTYIWDYFISPYWSSGNPDEDAKRLSWWPQDNIKASCFVEDAGDLYYGSRTDGRTIKFTTVYDGTQFYDFGSAINAVYRIPLRDLGDGQYEFDVLDCWIDCRGDTKTSITVTYITSDDMNGDPSTDEIVVGSFSYDNFSYDTFTYQIMGFKETFPLAPREKKIDLFGIEFTNNEPGRDMNISDIKYSYRLGKEK